MANLFAIHSVGNSLATYLTNAYPAALRAEHPCTFSLVSSGQFNELGEPDGTTVTIYLYRVMIDEHARNGARPGRAERRDLPLGLDLHYLFSVWSGSAVAEQVALAWTMRELHQRPILDASLLSPEGGWGAGDGLQLIPSEIADADLMRIWDALAPAYRISVPYVARIVQIDPDTTADSRPVVATRFEVGDEVQPPGGAR